MPKIQFDVNLADGVAIDIFYPAYFCVRSLANNTTSTHIFTGLICIIYMYDVFDYRKQNLRKEQDAPCCNKVTLSFDH